MLPPLPWRALHRLDFGATTCKVQMRADETHLNNLPGLSQMQLMHCKHLMSLQSQLPLGWFMPQPELVHNKRYA